MDDKIGNVTVNRCSLPAFMGHEELVVPMLVLDSSEWSGTPRMGAFCHCLNDEFQANDLSNTAVMGYTSGIHRGLDLDRFFFPFFDEWKEVPEITDALEALGRAYAWFHETSSAPLQDAYIKRCRFIGRNRLHDFHRSADIEAETSQSTPAAEVLDAFLRDAFWEPDFQAIYGDYFSSHERNLYGDDEQYSCRTAIWLEQNGVLRAWSRVAYVPK